MPCHYRALETYAWLALKFESSITPTTPTPPPHHHHCSCSFPVQFLGPDGRGSCLVTLLAAVLTGQGPTHPILSSRLTGHTFKITSGGVPSTSSSADVELAPTIMFCGNTIIGEGATVLDAAVSQTLKLIRVHQLQEHPPAQVARMLAACLKGIRERMQQEAGGQPAVPEDVSQDALMAITVMMQQHVQLAPHYNSAAPLQELSPQAGSSRALSEAAGGSGACNSAGSEAVGEVGGSESVEPALTRDEGYAKSQAVKKWLQMLWKKVSGCARGCAHRWRMRLCASYPVSGPVRASSS